MMDMHTDQILTIRTPPPINEVRREPTFYLRALVLVMASCLTIGKFSVGFSCGLPLWPPRMYGRHVLPSVC